MGWNCLYVCRAGSIRLQIFFDENMPGADSSQAYCCADFGKNWGEADRDDKAHFEYSSQADLGAGKKADI